MNASWYEEIKEGGDIYSCILNIAYQDGKPLGALSQYKYGQKNRVGDCLIYYKNGSVYYAEGVKDSSDSRVPKTSGSWAQGGMGLFLGNSNWLSLFRNQPMTTEDYSKGTAPRSGMVVNTNTKDVYLFAVPVASTDLISFRQIIMDYFGLKDGASNSYIRAILLDGGASTELYGNDFYAHTTIQHKIRFGHLRYLRLYHRCLCCSSNQKAVQQYWRERNCEKSGNFLDDLSRTCGGSVSCRIHGCSSICNNAFLSVK